MLNYIWLGMILIAMVLATFTHKLGVLSTQVVADAELAVKLSLNLIGIMTLWLGLMRLAERSGLVATLGRMVQPLLRWLFRDIPAGHPAMGSVTLNIAANMLGLNNAATPLGLRAMKDLEALNPKPGTASDAMCMFLAINTSSVQLIPISAMALLASAGSKNPTLIVGTTLLATLASTAVGISAAKFFASLKLWKEAAPSGGPMPTPSEPITGVMVREELRPPAAMTKWGGPALIVLVLCFGWAWVEIVQAVPEAGQPEKAIWLKALDGLSLLSIPFLVAFFPLYAAARQLAVYEEFVEGAKEGFHTAIRIIPYLLGMLVAIGLFRAAGGVDLITTAVRPLVTWLGIPSEVVPLAVIRPLTGSGSYGILGDLVKQFGPDSLIARTAATLYGSTETTLYVVAVYFGSVGIKRTRYALAAGLLADAAGVLAAAWVCKLVFKG